MSGGSLGSPLIGPPWCRETLVDQKHVCLFAVVFPVCTRSTLWEQNQNLFQSRHVPSAIQVTLQISDLCFDEDSSLSKSEYLKKSGNILRHKNIKIKSVTLWETIYLIVLRGYICRHFFWKFLFSLTSIQLILNTVFVKLRLYMIIFMRNKQLLYHIILKWYEL